MLNAVDNDDKLRDTFMRIHAFSTQFKTSGLELQPFPLLFARHAV
jgi:hypothetical protein